MNTLLDTGHRRDKQLNLLACLVIGWILSGCAFPFFNAATNGDTEKVLILLHDGTDVNMTFPIIGTHALMVAAAFGHIDTVKTLIDTGADVNAKDLTGWTPLHAAAFKGNLHIVRLLLASGAVPQPSTWFLESPSVMAEHLGYTEIIPILKQAELQTVAKNHHHPCHPDKPLPNASPSATPSQQVC